jgi:hypothetical protein
VREQLPQSTTFSSHPREVLSSLAQQYDFVESFLLKLKTYGNQQIVL